MKTFGLTGKAGRPRYLTDPLVTERVAEEDAREVYTALEDAAEGSALSRMSIGR